MIELIQKPNTYIHLTQLIIYVELSHSLIIIIVLFEYYKIYLNYKKF